MQQSNTFTLLYFTFTAQALTVCFSFKNTSLNPKNRPVYVEDYGLTDTWRLQNPSKREYSYYSPYHKLYPHIDYWLTTLSDPTIHCIALSDHAPVTMTFLADSHFNTSGFHQIFWSRLDFLSRHLQHTYIMGNSKSSNERKNYSILHKPKKKKEHHLAWTT